MRRSRYSKKPQPQPQAVPVVDTTHKIRYLLAETVLLNTGRPDDLVKIESKTVGDSCYRVTLVREVGRKITRRDSFYIEMSEDGFITYCHPPFYPIEQQCEVTLSLRQT